MGDKYFFEKEGFEKYVVGRINTGRLSVEKTSAGLEVGYSVFDPDIEDPIHGQAPDSPVKLVIADYKLTRVELPVEPSASFPKIDEEFGEGFVIRDYEGVLKWFGEKAAGLAKRLPEDNSDRKNLLEVRDYLKEVEPKLKQMVELF